MFGTWAGLMTQLGLMRAVSNNDGVYEILFDDSITSPTIIPAAGSPHDLTRCKLRGRNGSCNLNLADGVTFTGLRHFGDNLFVTSLSVQPSPVPCTDFAAGFDGITIENGANINVTDDNPIWDLTSGGVGLTFIGYFRDRGTISQNPGGGRPVIHVGAGQTVFLTAMAASGIWRGGLSSVAGSTVFYQHDTTCLLGVLPAVLGTFTRFTTIWGPDGNVQPDPTLAAAIAPIAGLQFYQTYIRCDVSGGGFTQLLPSLPQANGSRGDARRVLIKEESGTTGLLVDGAGANTIEGLAAAVAVPAGGSITFLADGVSNWIIEDIFDPAFTPVIGAMASNGLIFREGAPDAGPVVFGTWAGLMARLTQLRAASNGSGIYTIGLDDSVTSPLTIPAAGSPHDMTLCRLQPADGLDSTAFVDIADGASFARLRHIHGRMFVTSLAVAPSPSPIADFVLFDEMVISGGCNLVVTGAVGNVPFIDLSVGAGDFADLVLRDFGTFLGGSDPVAHFGTAGASYGLTMEEVTGAIAGTLSSDAGAIVFASCAENSAHASAYPLFLGAFASDAIIPGAGPEQNILPLPPLPAAVAPFGAFFSSHVQRFDASGGAIAQLLPSLPVAGGQYGGRGRRITILEESGSAGLTIGPAGGDTIEGIAAAVPVPAGGAVVLIGDGVSNWAIESIWDPQGDCMVVTGPFVFPAGGAVGIRDLAMVDVSGGVVPLTLPAITPANSGCKLIVKKIAGGGAAFTLAPAGADTIDGAAGVSAFGGALISVTLRSDGVSNWMVV